MPNNSAVYVIIGTDFSEDRDRLAVALYRCDDSGNLVIERTLYEDEAREYLTADQRVPQSQERK